MTTRRRVASLCLLVGAIIVGGMLLRARGDLVAVEITYRMGPDSWVDRLESELRPAAGGENVARFVTKVTGGEVTHRTRVPPGDYEAFITLTGKDGTSTVFTSRTVHAAEGATVYVNLETTRPR